MDFTGMVDLLELSPSFSKTAEIKNIFTSIFYNESIINF